MQCCARSGGQHYSTPLLSWCPSLTAAEMPGPAGAAAEAAQRALSVQFVQKPQDGSADALLDVVLTPSYVVYSGQCMSGVPQLASACLRSLGSACSRVSDHSAGLLWGGVVFCAVSRSLHPTRFHPCQQVQPRLWTGLSSSSAPPRSWT